VLGRRVQERVQVRVDDAIQHAPFRVVRLIRRASERHWGGDIRLTRGREQCGKRDTSKELG